MSSFSPSSPLLTLVVTPKGSCTTQDILAKFHPIMKQRGYGNFEMEETGFYLASKPGDGILSAVKFVFAEVENDSVAINIDRTSIFGLKGVEKELNAIKDAYDSSLDCVTIVNGPNYTSAFLGNFLYTALPIYSSAAIVALVMYQIGGFPGSHFINVFLYATLGIIGAKTKYWVNERRKQRPVWRSVLVLFLAAPAVLAVWPLFSWPSRPLAKAYSEMPETNYHHHLLTS